MIEVGAFNLKLTDSKACIHAFCVVCKDRRFYVYPKDEHKFKIGVLMEASCSCGTKRKPEDIEKLKFLLNWFWKND